MFRQLAQLLTVEDVIGLLGFVLVTAAAAMVDLRLGLFVAGALLILLAVARAQPGPPPPPPGVES